jgi:hypothetical protein
MLSESNLAKYRPCDGQNTVPCKRCGDETRMLGTKLCDNCWELESRLAGLWARARHLTAENARLRERVRELEGRLHD